MILLAATALIYAALDPDFGWNNASFVMFAGLLGGPALTTFLFEGGQVLVVTHSPQVAARGATHLLIAKSHDGLVPRTGVERLDEGRRREEIARMLSGAEITDEARAQAERLLEAA